MLWPFLFLKSTSLINDQVFMNHERIHRKQQLEMLVFLFIVWYVLEYLVLRLKYNHDNAYRNIVFEKEAYLMDHDLNYLKNRKFWSFLRFYKIPCK